MPLEVHDYLVAQGWGGKGTGLRLGAISRPLAIPQKKNLAGLGKDRDEAFPFWDHLFDAAAKSIQLKCFSDDEDESNETSISSGVSIKKTSTGIFSTRCPIDGTPADSGSITPNEAESDSQTPRLSLMAIAKRDAAKRRLYAQFFRGPVLGPETIAEEEKRLAALVQEAFDKQNPDVQSITITGHIEVQTADKRMVFDLEVSKSKSSAKKRKVEEAVEAASESDSEDEDARKERKRRRKEKKRQKEEKEAAKLKRKEEKKAKKAENLVNQDCVASSSSSKHVKEGKTDDVDKAERRRKKEEKKKLKMSGSLNQESAVVEEDVASEKKATVLEVPKTSKENPSSPKRPKIKDDGNEQQEKKKKKRKREDNPDSSN